MPAGAIQVFAEGVAGNPGLAVFYGRVGRGVTAVTINRSGRYAPVRGRVAHGWYAALWTRLSDRTHATRVRITARSMTRTYWLPAADRIGVPHCGTSPRSSCGSGVAPGQIVGR